MASYRLTASLDDFPREILIKILTDVADLKALYHLTRAFPAAYRLFNAVGPEILEHVLTESVPRQLHELVRLVGAIRMWTPRNPMAPSLETFLSQYIRSAEYDKEYFPCAPPLTQSFNDREELGDIRRLLLIARRIACLTPLCISYYRDRCMSVTLSHKVERRGVYYGSAMKPWRERYDGKHYQPQDIGPSTWVEEQRVMRGFWRLQVFQEFKRAVSEGRTGWVAESNQQAYKMAPETLFEGWRLQLEEVLTVTDFLKEYAIESKENTAIQAHTISLPKPRSEGEPTASWPVLAEAPRPDAWPGWTSHLNAPSAAWSFFGHLHINPRSPIRGVDFWPFRQLGLAIWEREKLIRLELMSPVGASAGRGPLRGRGDQEFTWRSILSEGYLAEVERRLEEDWQRRNAEE